MAHAKGSVMCIIEFSFLPKDTLAVWVLSGTSDLLCSTTVLPWPCWPGQRLSKTKDHTNEQLLGKASTSMIVRGGRYDLQCNHYDDLTDSDTDQTVASSHAEADVTSGTWLLQEIYQMLLQPIQAFLVGLKELHQELFKELLTALIDTDGQYLILHSTLRDPC